MPLCLIDENIVCDSRDYRKLYKKNDKLKARHITLSKKFEKLRNKYLALLKEQKNNSCVKPKKESKAVPIVELEHMTPEEYEDYVKAELGAEIEDLRDKLYEAIERFKKLKYLPIVEDP